MFLAVNCSSFERTLHARAGGWPRFADTDSATILRSSDTNGTEVHISELAPHVQLHDHVVQFYASDTELFDRVGGHLREAVRSGAVAIVLASPAHARGFGAWLTASGVDVDEIAAAGAYRVFDAEETLQRFLIDGRPDARLFDEVVGELVRAAAGTGRPVCAYGEMVALLWDDGRVNAAIELEALWNDLSLRVPFSLFCAYPSSAVTQAEDDELFSQICCSHTGVIGGEPHVRSTQRFDASAEAASASRRSSCRRSRPSRVRS